MGPGRQRGGWVHPEYWLTGTVWVRQIPHRSNRSSFASWRRATQRIERSDSLIPCCPMRCFLWLGWFPAVDVLARTISLSAIQQQ